jgi:hypothetical protein
MECLLQIIGSGKPIDIQGNQGNTFPAFLDGTVSVLFFCSGKRPHAITNGAPTKRHPTKRHLEQNVISTKRHPTKHHMTLRQTWVFFHSK